VGNLPHLYPNQLVELVGSEPRPEQLHDWQLYPLHKGGKEDPVVKI
jgi:hypothetical protein